MSESVSVLCVTHGRPDLVMKCLRSCTEQDYPDKEIVLLLNPADETTEREIRRSFPAVRVLKTHQNIGFFPALNVAIANCNGDFVMIVDDDAWFLASNALSKLVQCFRDEPELGAVTCNLEGPNENPIKDGDRYIRAFTTGFTMLPRKVMTEWVGPVPDLFFRSAGETFWCTQLWEQRRPVKRVQDVRMFHELSMKGRSASDWYFYALRSQLLCAVMREPASWLLPVLASKMAKSLMTYLKRRHLLIWIKAWLSFLVHLPAALRLRRPVSSRTRRLLQRLDRSPVRSLAGLREWTSLTAARNTALQVERQVI
jgi:GT2 family glycosyltransferase